MKYLVVNTRECLDTKVTADRFLVKFIKKNNEKQVPQTTRDMV